MLNLIKYRKLFIVISLIVIVPGTLALILFGLNVGIDFKGGTNVVLRPQQAVASSDTIDNLLKPFNLESTKIVLGQDKSNAAKTAWVRFNTVVDDNVINSAKTALGKKYTNLGYSQANITNAGTPFTLLTVSKFTTLPNADDIKSALTNLPKTGGTTAVSLSDVKVGSSSQTINIETLTEVNESATSGNKKVNLTDIQGSFIKNGGPYFQIQSDSTVGPSVAGRTTEMAFLAVVAASVLILLYVWFSFRKVPRALRYGVCAIVALLHDVLVVTGIFAILGRFFNVQIDALFITALLTVIGFSVHDTIVVFDRIRENLLRSTTETFEEVVNASLVQTLARSLNTSLTVLLTLLTLTLFTGIGTDIHTFTLALLIGVFSGTYSSIFNASMLLVIWNNGEMGTKYLQPKREELPAKRTREARELAQTHG